MREGIVWDAVSFTDNTICLELIAMKPTGLLYVPPGRGVQVSREGCTVCVRREGEMCV